MTDSTRPPSRVWRNAWLFLGFLLLLLLVLELGYRGQAAFREARRESRVADNLRGVLGGKLNPYADSSWAQAFFAERDSLASRWEPFVYYRARPHFGRFFTIDSSGIRVTPQVHRPGSPPLRVFFFGGSTTWGFANRDSTTRPALMARRLADLGYDPEVVNLAQSGWVSVQGMLTLVQQLRAGNIPDVVIFWDGEHDVPSAWRNGRPGLSYREPEHQEDSRFGSEMRRHGGVVSARLAVRSLLMKSQLMRRATQGRDQPLAERPVPDPVALCQGVVADWLNEVRFIDQLAAQYSFVPLMIWQPQWHTSNRPRTAFEKQFAEGAEPWMGEVQQGPHREDCARQVDSLVAAKVSPSIINLATLHAADTNTVFFDPYGRTTERATVVEADTLVGLLRHRLAALKRPLPGRASSPAP